MRLEENPEGTGDETLRDLGLTLMYPCLGQPDRISRLLEGWDNWWLDTKQHVKIVLVDDHGTPSIESMLAGREMDYDLSVYRIEDDVKYNMPGAMNLGAMVASTPWLLMMDTDYSFPRDDIHRLLQFRPRPEETYAFYLDRVTDGVHVARDTKVHTNTFLIHKDMFTDLNGFDEDFGGGDGYGYHDCAFRLKLKEAGYEVVQQRGYTATEWVDDKNTGYTREEQGHNAIVWRNKREGKVPNSTDMLRFKWKKVLHNRREI